MGMLSGLPLAPTVARAEPNLEKQRGLSAERMAEIVRADVIERQFLATADFTRAIYDESATFTGPCASPLICTDVRSDPPLGVRAVHTVTFPASN